MKQTESQILTVNGGSSSIKFALYQSGEPLEQRLSGMIDRIGHSGTKLTVNKQGRNHSESVELATSTYKVAASFLVDWLEDHGVVNAVQGVGHRVVHGMQHTQPELTTQELLE